MIPTTSSRVNVKDLDPLTKYRVSLLLADPEMKGYKVVSGVRTLAQQKALYSGWRSRLPGYNPAANPYRVIGTSDDGITFKGSYHMQQSSGYGYAVDLRRPWNHSKARASALVDRVGTRLGLLQTVRGEWWHLQARNITGYFAGPQLPKIETEDEEFPIMETLIDSETNEGWVVAGNRARKLSDPSGWLESWAGPTRGSKSMRFVVDDLYDLVG